MPRVSRLLPFGWALVLTLLMLGPALGPGYVLSYDMVWVPDLALRTDFLGLGSGLPRAVPSDAVVAVLDEVVPGMVLQKAVLVLTLVMAGAGAWWLVPEGGSVARLAASTLYVWNPFVAERLGIGHWPLLMAYASLPWIYLAARRWVAGERALPALVLWMAFGSLSPVGGTIAAIFAVVSVALPRRGALRRVALVSAAAAALNAPWIVAGILHGSGSVSDPLGVSAFAAQGAGDMPTFLTVLGLGGVWNAEVVLASRSTWAGVAALLVVVALSIVGVARWRERTLRTDRVALVVAGALGLALALAGSVMPGAVGWLVAHVPGMGLVRDGARFVALLAPLQVTLFGLGVARVAAAVPTRPLGIVVATGLILAPVSLLPDAALGLSGQLRPASFPTEFGTARQALEVRREAGRRGDLLSLPFSSYRRPHWNHERRTLDPVGRFFPVNYLASDTLVVSGRTIAGEDPRARRVARMLDSLEGAALEAALRNEGITWVVLDREAAREVEPTTPVADLGADRAIHDGELLTVWEVPGPAEERVGTADNTLLSLLLLGLGWTAAIGALGAAAVLAGRRRLGNLV